MMLLYVIVEIPRINRAYRDAQNRPNIVIVLVIIIIIITTHTTAAQ